MIFRYKKSAMDSANFYTIYDGSTVNLTYPMDKVLAKAA